MNRIFHSISMQCLTKGQGAVLRLWTIRIMHAVKHVFKMFFLYLFEVWFDCLLFVDESGREELYFLWNCCFKNLKVKRPYTSFCNRYSISTLNWNNLTLVTHWSFFFLQKNTATTKWDIALWPTATKSTKTAHEWCSTRPK